MLDPSITDLYDDSTILQAECGRARTEAKRLQDAIHHVCWTTRRRLIEHRQIMDQAADLIRDVRGD